MTASHLRTLAGPLVAAVLLLCSGAARAQSLSIEVDMGQAIRLSQPAASVFVANPQVADIQLMSPRLVYVYGRGEGTTQVFAIDADDRVLVDRTVVVRRDLGRLANLLQETQPGSAIRAVPVEGGILLTGEAESLGEVENARRLAASFLTAEGDEVINQVSVSGSQQISLRVRIAEVSRRLSKTFGFNWEAFASFGDFDFALGVGRDIISDTGQVTRQNDTNSLFGSYTSGDVDLNGLIDALAAEDLITVLAEPNLTARSGETASFLAGGEFPIPVAQDGGDSITIEFKEFGIQLAFRPTVVSPGEIALTVRPEISQISPVGAIRVQNLEIPALTTRRAQTAVSVGSGESFAIAGLLQNDMRSQIDRFPLLGDLPVLGPLFRSTSFQSEESELVIIVTPYLVRPAQADQLRIPNEGYTPPSDVDLIMRGQLIGSRDEAPGGLNMAGAQTDFSAATPSPGFLIR